MTNLEHFALTGNHTEKYNTTIEFGYFVLENSKFPANETHHQSWSSGRAITTPNIDTSNSNNQVGKDFLRWFSMSLWGSTLFKPSNKGEEISAWVGMDDTCSWSGCTRSCCSSYFSTYSGNNFLKVGLRCKISELKRYQTEGLFKQLTLLWKIVDHLSCNRFCTAWTIQLKAIIWNKYKVCSVELVVDSLLTIESKRSLSKLLFLSNCCCYTACGRAGVHLQDGRHKSCH